MGVAAVQETSARARAFLRAHMYTDAMFLADMVFPMATGEADIEELVNILAECHFANDRIKLAYSLTASSKSYDNRMLFAKCCIQLDNYVEAESTLLELLSDKASLSAFQKGCVYSLLGQVGRRVNRIPVAVSYYKQALESDPFQVSAFRSLINLDKNAQVETLFSDSAPSLLVSFAAVSAQKENVSVANAPHDQRAGNQAASQVPRNAETPVASRISSSSSMLKPGALFSPHASSPAVTPSAAPSRLRYPTRATQRHIGAPSTAMDSTVASRRMRTATAPTAASTARAAVAHPAAPTRPVRGTAVQQTPIATPSVASSLAPALAAGRTLGGSWLNESPATPSGALQTPSLVMGPPQMPSLATPMYPSRGDTAAGAREALGILRAFARVLAALQRSDLERCWEAMERIPAELQNGALVLELKGRVSYEQVDYVACEGYLETLRRTHPHHLGGLDLLSCALWHLKKQTVMSHLARDLDQIEPRAGETWIAVGNCFSLERDGENAIRCFQRACQVDRDNALPRTLSGHEFAARDAFLQAEQCFLDALSLDARCYSAYYGLGLIAFRQERFDRAESCFRAAVKCNPTPLVLCQLAKVRRRAKDYKEALSLLTLATTKETKVKVSMIHLEKAQAHMLLKDYAAAKEELLTVIDMAPTEWTAYYLLTRAHQHMGNVAEAVRCRMIAANLEPKKPAIPQQSDTSMRGEDGEEDEASVLDRTQ